MQPPAIDAHQHFWNPERVPPLGRDDFSLWAQQLRTAAEYPDVNAKISGLNTALDRSDWGGTERRPAIEVALRVFGPDRLLCGSDWPVSLLNDGGYQRIWVETRRALELVALDDAPTSLHATARRLYRLDAIGREAVLADSGREAPDGSH